MSTVRFFDWLGLQLRRAAKHLPQLIALTLLLALLALAAGYVPSVRSGSDEAKQKIRVGVVGASEDPSLRAAFRALETFDLTRFSLELRFMEETEAAAALDRGSLAAYVAFPEGFVEGMQLGEHRPLRFVTAGSGAGLGGRLMQEIAGIASDLLLESENAVYGAQRYIAEKLPGLDPWDEGDALALRYLLTALDRTSLYEVETVGTGGGLSFAGYWLCGLSVAFLLLSGLNAAPLATRRPEELGGMLRARGLGAVGQTAGEFLPFALLSVAAALCGVLLAALLAGGLGLRVPELGERTTGELLGLLPRALPAVLMISAMQFALYELVPGVVPSLTLQVLNALAQAYASGCFYPASFFPEAFRRFGELLPAGFARRELASLLSGVPDGAALCGVLVWLAAFLALAAAVRAVRLRR